MTDEDARVQSAVNTLKGWRMRREAKGRAVTSADVEARIRALWPDVGNVEIARIVGGVMA